jgi:hypothetical protein
MPSLVGSELEAPFSRQARSPSSPLTVLCTAGGLPDITIAFARAAARGYCKLLDV